MRNLFRPRTVPVFGIIDTARYGAIVTDPQGVALTFGTLEAATVHAAAMPGFVSAIRVK